MVVRRQLENIAHASLALFLFSIPILIFRHHLYEWMNIPAGQDPVLDSKRSYLNWHFFLFRAFFYFYSSRRSCLFAAAFFGAQDRDGNPRYTV